MREFVLVELSKSHGQLRSTFIVAGAAVRGMPGDFF